MESLGVDIDYAIFCICDDYNKYLRQKLLRERFLLQLLILLNHI